MFNHYCNAGRVKQAQSNKKARIQMKSMVLLLAGLMMQGCSDDSVEAAQKIVEEAAQEVRPDVVISNAWVRAVPPVSTTSAAYFSLTNHTASAVTLVGAQVDFSDDVELHDMSMNEDGIRNMKHIAELAVSPGETVTLAPGGLHMMLFGLTSVPKEGEDVNVCVQFSDAPQHCEIFPVLREAK